MTATQPTRSFAGYVGAIAILATVFIWMVVWGGELSGYHYFFFWALTLLVMVVYEVGLRRDLSHRHSEHSEESIQSVLLGKSRSSSSNMDSSPKAQNDGVGAQSDGRGHRSHLVKSTTMRYMALLVVFTTLYGFVMILPYFSAEMFEATREFFTLAFFSYVTIGWGYIYLTLKFRGGQRYEFEDYGILLLIAFRSIIKAAKANSEFDHRLKNRRVTKVFRLFVVNTFFATLMVAFFMSQYDSLREAFIYLLTQDLSLLSNFQIYQLLFVSIFHSLFIIDVTVALVGYLIASRWLGNRTKSVDATIFGWAVVLICYPPFNSYMFDYGSFESYDIITAEWAKMVMMGFVIGLYIIYVWGTVELGFRFSNLTNRGIVTTGPYAIVRHPAYMSKNIAWWIESSFVLSNIWASLVLLGWNIVYILRGITEERHLSKDKGYREYMKKTKWRFLPKVF